MRNNHLLANCKNFPSVHIFLLHSLSASDSKRWTLTLYHKLLHHRTSHQSDFKRSNKPLVNCFPEIQTFIKRTKHYFWFAKKDFALSWCCFFVCLRESNAWKQFTSVSFKRMKLFFQNDLWCHSSPFVVWSGQTVQEKIWTEGKFSQLTNKWLFLIKFAALQKENEVKLMTGLLLRELLSSRILPELFQGNGTGFKRGKA